jgi:hypothetical protein
MNEILKKQIWRKLEDLPDEKGYQVLDYIRFLEREYADGESEAKGLRRFAELLQDEMRRRRIPASAVRESMRVIGATDRVLGAFREAADEFMAELEQGRPEPAPEERDRPPRRREVVIE